MDTVKRMNRHRLHVQPRVNQCACHIMICNRSLAFQPAIAYFFSDDNTIRAVSVALWVDQFSPLTETPLAVAAWCPCDAVNDYTLLS